MALTVIRETSDKKDVSNSFGEEIKRTGPYEYVDTNNEGIKRVVSKQGGYLVFLDYGRRLKEDKKTGLKVMKQDKTCKRVDTEGEAKKLRREAEEIREGKDPATHKKKKVTMEDVIADFKLNERYLEFGESYQEHYDNYMKHMLDYFKDFEPSKITAIDIENYYHYQRTRGNLLLAKNKDGTVSKKMISKSNPEGISINTLGKHKTAMKNIWEFMIDSKKYGVTENVVLIARMPKETITVNGKLVKVSKVQPKKSSYTIDQLNYMLNDALQNEFDRSIVLMIALAAIGGLRHSEVIGLSLGKFKHDELMSISDESFEYGGFDKQFYIEHDELMLIDEAVMCIRAKEVRKLPKGERIRIAAIPNVLREIVEYAMEQRQEILDTTGRKLNSQEQLYLPLVNILENRELKSQKMGRKWTNYQKRRTKRMEKAGLKPIPEIRYHDLRHTHGNLLKIDVPAWEISCNMGHLIPDANTTQKVYWNDRQPYRQHIIDYFDNNIKIDWDKAIRKKINDDDVLLHVNGSGHLVIKDENKEKVKNLRKRLVLSEDEIAEMLYLDEHAVLN